MKCREHPVEDLTYLYTHNEEDGAPEEGPA